MVVISVAAAFILRYNIDFCIVNGEILLFFADNVLFLSHDHFDGLIFSKELIHWVRL